MHTPQTHPRRLRTPEAAAYCGTSTSNLNKRRCRGELPRYLKLGKTVVYDTTDLDEWLESCRRRSTSEVAPEPQTQQKLRHAPAKSEQSHGRGDLSRKAAKHATTERSS